MSPDKTAPYVFAGTYHRPLDDKGRLTMPAEWREEDEPAKFFISYSASEQALKAVVFSVVEQKLEQVRTLDPRDPVRANWQAVLQAGQTIVPDRTGRLNISGDLLRRAGVSAKAVLAGGIDAFLVMSPETFADRAKPDVGCDLVNL